MCKINLKINTTTPTGTSIISVRGRYKLQTDVDYTYWTICSDDGYPCNSTLPDVQTPDITVNGFYELGVMVTNSAGSPSEWAVSSFEVSSTCGSIPCYEVFDSFGNSVTNLTANCSSGMNGTLIVNGESVRVTIKTVKLTGTIDISAYVTITGGNLPIGGWVGNDNSFSGQDTIVLPKGEYTITSTQVDCSQGGSGLTQLVFTECVESTQKITFGEHHLLQINATGAKAVWQDTATSQYILAQHALSMMTYLVGDTNIQESVSGLNYWYPLSATGYKVYKSNLVGAAEVMDINKNGTGEVRWFQDGSGQVVVEFRNIGVSGLGALGVLAYTIG